MDRYLLSPQVFVDFSRKSDEQLLSFLGSIHSTQMFISSVTVGIVHQAVEAQPPERRNQFRQRFRDGMNAFEERVLPLDAAIAREWATLRPLVVFRDLDCEAAGIEMGEDEKLILATAIEGSMVYLGTEPVFGNRTTCEELGLIVVNPYPAGCEPQ